jgi:hypothetical protein
MRRLSRKAPQRSIEGLRPLGGKNKVCTLEHVQLGATRGSSGRVFRSHGPVRCLFEHDLFEKSASHFSGSSLGRIAGGASGIEG